MSDIKIVVQPYTRLGNNSPALEAWDVLYPEDVVRCHGSDEASVQWAVDKLLLAAAQRTMKVEVKRLKNKAVQTLPTDPAPR
jgi:hypothetical protein